MNTQNTWHTDIGLLATGQIFDMYITICIKPIPKQHFVTCDCVTVSSCHVRSITDGDAADTSCHVSWNGRPPPPPGCTRCHTILWVHCCTCSEILTHPFQLLEVFSEKTDWILRPGHAQLHYALLQDLLNVVLLDIGLTLTKTLLLIHVSCHQLILFCNLV